MTFQGYWNFLNKSLLSFPSIISVSFVQCPGPQPRGWRHCIRKMTFLFHYYCFSADHELLLLLCLNRDCHFSPFWKHKVASTQFPPVRTDLKLTQFLHVLLCLSSRIRNMWLIQKTAYRWDKHKCLRCRGHAHPCLLLRCFWFQKASLYYFIKTPCCILSHSL